jgi:drug/metabolite transporter (DMT)-like permease
MDQIKQHQSPSKLQADLLLLLVCVFWGTTFILSKILLAEISLLYYLALRLGIATILMWFIAIRYRRQLDRPTFLAGVILGIFLFLSYLFQMWGIQYTSASNAGFITGINVILVPVFSAILFKERPKIMTLIGIVLATWGLYFLSGGNFAALNKGDLLVLVCALAAAFHIIFTGHFAPRHNIYLLMAVQLSTIAILNLILFSFSNEKIVPLRPGALLILIYLAIFGSIVTFLLQTSMQRFTTATRTALIFTTEPLFAALFAFLIAGEQMNALGWLGGLLILLGMIVSELNWSDIFKRDPDRCRIP